MLLDLEAFLLGQFSHTIIAAFASFVINISCKQLESQCKNWGALDNNKSSVVRPSRRLKSLDGTMW